ncbi:hypothetical protein [Novosphingobium pentaromativorans]|uniref:Uncharacterized protein n=1 Tax=Novosphingobium pentaromativorans US6-1 TaxID=1088721 RepID=G6EJ24_9SPHN|nr:hypothetical protein [Novosphingobium pentaromativorans]EHJ58783.1 hypothetical protein NSU_4345 [Novosphingobium pentaromativorans US6-1]
MRKIVFPPAFTTALGHWVPALAEQPQVSSGRKRAVPGGGYEPLESQE